MVPSQCVKGFCVLGQKIITDAAHTLWELWNKHETDTFRVPRDTLNQYIEEEGGRVPFDLMAVQPRTGSTTVEVRRAQLYTLLSGGDPMPEKQEWNK